MELLIFCIDKRVAEATPRNLRVLGYEICSDYMPRHFKLPEGNNKNTGTIKMKELISFRYDGPENPVPRKEEPIKDYEVILAENDSIPRVLAGTKII